MTVTTTGATPVALSNIIATGTSGATTKTASFYLDVVNATFGAASLTTPVNNATTQNTTLSLVWGAGAGATSYDVQVASDIAFTTIVSSGNTTSTNYTVSGLAQGTDYYWRVLPKNATCNGAYGSSFKFTTGIVSCSVSASTNVPLTIAPTGKPQIVSTLNIPAGVSISDINITMNISNTNVFDLKTTLTGPTAVAVQLYNQPCGTTDNINATFDDSGTTLVCGTNPTISGTVIPLQALSAFNNTSSTGNWTLTIKDNSAGDGGTLNSWSLNICNIQPVLSN